MQCILHFDFYLLLALTEYIQNICHSFLQIEQSNNCDVLVLFYFQFEYYVTCAVCSRTGEKELQILKKFTQV